VAAVVVVVVVVALVAFVNVMLELRRRAIITTAACIVMDGLYGHIVSVEIDLFYLKGKPIDDKTESGFTSVPHFSQKNIFLPCPTKRRPGDVGLGDIIMLRVWVRGEKKTSLTQSIKYSLTHFDFIVLGV
jgi:hypothetical protein